MRFIVIALLFIVFSHSVQAKAIRVHFVPNKQYENIIQKIDELQKDLSKDREMIAQIHDNEYPPRPIEIYPYVIKSESLQKTFLFVQEVGSFSCGAQLCSLKGFDISNIENPLKIIDTMTVEGMTILECKNSYSLILVGHGYGADQGEWRFKNDKFEFFRNHSMNYTPECPSSSEQTP